MGQWTIGVLYGCESPEGVTLYDDDSDEGGLLDKCDGAFRDAILAHDEACTAKVMAKPGRMPYDYEDGRSRYVPDWETDGKPHLLGFWVAAGASGKNGLPSLNRKAVALEDIPTTEPYARAYRNARRRWRRFARWAKTQGVTLPKPRLYLTPTEVA